MYAIGMLGSYFSQGVYAVAGPFQGAVDIIVVKQEDGTYKSSPWYVKCGDFQGVLTRREKIVNISVNGAPAEFYMLLNSRGEAYFEKEVEDAVLALPSTSSSERTEAKEKLDKSGSLVSQTTKGDSGEEGELTSFGNIENQDISQQDNSSFQDPPVPDPANLHNEEGIPQEEFDMGNESTYADDDRNCTTVAEAGIMDPQAVSKTASNLSDFELELKPVVINVRGEGLILADADRFFSEQENFEPREQGPWPLEIGAGLQNSPDEHMADPLNDLGDAITGRSETNDAVLCDTVITEDWFGLQEPSNSEPGNKNASYKSDLEASNQQSMNELIWNDYKIVTAEEEGALNDSLKADAVLGVRIDGENSQSLPSDTVGTGPFDPSIWISDALVDDATSGAAREDWNLRQNIDGGPSAGATSKKDIICRVDEKPPTEDGKGAEIPAITVVPPSSRWTMWPFSFRRSRGEEAPVSQSVTQKQALLAATNIAVGSPLTEEILRKNGYFGWPQKPKLRSYVPTSEQIESLKLNEGPNKVTFFFPRVLGKTQVDANIYLWKWNTRIVISDVDGTITKSDVLGQFMPLVGRDWSQSGVTRLFSAIKENGYEVLFLSARAISQAYLTRQFLINLKQDGETLPEGPVFISPDGLIPSLYREVVRRTPHEFKISCLEGIRRLFPNDVNPFYAGFGNRDTDEISYLKVGIPKGKIFIINPKGEVMVNHHVDVKSYTSIHALVDDMFPPVYSSAQEDFNSWNFWKLPLPSVDDDDEISSSAKSTKPKKIAGPKK